MRLLAAVLLGIYSSLGTLAVPGGQVVLESLAATCAKPRGQESLLDGNNPYPGGRSAPEVVYPGGRARGVISKNAHSHNDYWRAVPVYTALANGVRSIEADVWLNPKDNKLYVGHNVNSLTKARSFSHLYVDQLVKILEDTNVRDEEYHYFNETNFFSQDNVVEERRLVEPFFDEEPHGIQLLVDLCSSRFIFPSGPIQIVMTGNGYNHDVRAIVPTLATTDLFMDAREKVLYFLTSNLTVLRTHPSALLSLRETWTGVDGKTYGWNATSNAPVASAGYASVTTWRGREPISSAEMKALKKVFSDAQSLGFNTRAYSPPRWPIFVRDRVRKTLYEAGTDFLDADEMEDLAAF
ncbi:hypothetical protein P7C70_g3430, partial [Phenoliferia sp. Uapishka_3]